MAFGNLGALLMNAATARSNVMQQQAALERQIYEAGIASIQDRLRERRARRDVKKARKKQGERELVKGGIQGLALLAGGFGGEAAGAAGAAGAASAVGNTMGMPLPMMGNMAGPMLQAAQNPYVQQTISEAANPLMRQLGLTSGQLASNPLSRLNIF